MATATTEAPTAAAKNGRGTRSAKRQMERFLITGAGGQLGSELHRLFERRQQSLPKARESLDITDVRHVAEWFPTLKPDVVINCAAYTKVVQAEAEPEACWRVNALAVDNLAKVCAKHDIPLIHISTDHVFGREAGRRVPYIESDPIGPTCVYATAKAAGEQAILRQAAENPEFKFWIIRVAGLFERPWRDYWNFPMRLLSAARLRKGISLPVVNDVWTSPTYVPYLAEALAWLVEQRSYVASGIYHLPSAGSATWCQFAELLRRNIQAEFHVQPVSKEQWYRSKGVDPRLIPSYPVLSGVKYLDGLGGPPLPTWQEGVEAWCVAYRRSHA